MIIGIGSDQRECDDSDDDALAGGGGVIARC